MFKRQLLAVAALAAASLAHADVLVFSDNFDANATGLNTSPAGWTMSNGTVDIIGTGFFDFIPGNGRYIDMDGSTGDAGMISRQLTLTGGQLHTLSFALAGNHRNGAQESVAVVFGSAGSSYSLPMAAGFTTYTLSFTPSLTGQYTLSFEGAGRDNIGMLLDNVRVTSVPEPQTYALLALGLAAIGATALRRRRD